MMLFGIFLIVVFGWLLAYVLVREREDHFRRSLGDKILIGGLVGFIITMIIAGILTIIGSYMGVI